MEMVPLKHVVKSLREVDRKIALIQMRRKNLKFPIRIIVRNMLKTDKQK